MSQSVQVFLQLIHCLLNYKRIEEVLSVTCQQFKWFREQEHIHWAGRVNHPAINDLFIFSAMSLLIPASLTVLLELERISPKKLGFPHSPLFGKPGPDSPSAKIRTHLHTHAIAPPGGSPRYWCIRTLRSHLALRIQAVVRDPRRQVGVEHGTQRHSICPAAAEVGDVDVLCGKAEDP